MSLSSGPLDRHSIADLRNALIQLRTLQASALVTPTSDAQKVGLTQHLANAMLEHCEEFLGCWFAAKEEYEPLIQGFAGLLRRAGAVNADMVRRHQEAMKAQEEAASDKVLQMPVSNNQGGDK
jgi:hypothetical protein